MSSRSVFSHAVIIAVGSELLTPERIDTNSLFLTRELNEIGIRVRYKTVVGDDPGDLSTVLQAAIPQADLILITGGLGPTDDDITREAVASVFKLALEIDPALVDGIRSRFEARGLRMPEINRRQALIPRGAVVLPNERGTAAGLWVERPETVCVALPGPPRELNRMFEAIVRERLAPQSGRQRIFRRVLRVAGRTESHVEEATFPIYSRWRSLDVPIETSILASLGQIELHLSARGPTGEGVARVLDGATAELASVLGKDLVSTDGARLEDVVGQLLREGCHRVAVAESCTGGLVTSRLTDVPGSSAYVHAGWVAYSNDAKVDLLGVDRGLIETHGAVSEAVAEAMAVLGRRRAGVDYCLGVTGIAGPGGDRPTSR